jgi:hypothetical protein
MMAAHPKHAFKIAVASFLSIALLFAAAVDAKPKKKKARPSSSAERSIVIDAGLSITYDDNIINYSDADLDLFDSSATQGRFSIKSKDDWIFIPRINPRFTGKFLGGHPVWIDLGFGYYAYASNDVRRYSRVSLSARQYLSPRLYGEISYVLIPRYYYRNYQVGTDDIGAAIYAEAKFAKHMVAAEAGYDITKRLSATAAYKFQHKSFNSEFNFRDLNGHGFELGGAWRPANPIGFSATYGFERASASGADMADTVLDVSYDSWNIVFGARHYMSILSATRPELFGSFEIRNIKYQNDRYPQIFYFGREDFNYYAKAGISVRVPFQARGTIEYGFVQKKANLPDIYPHPGRVSQTTVELERKLNYRSNSITLRLTRRF